MRIPTRAFFNEQRKTRSMTQAMNPKAAPKFDEVKVPGGNVDWRVNKKVVPIHCWPVVVRISRTKIKGEYYKSVHAAKNTPGKVMVGLYLGRVVDTNTVSDGRWCVGIPGYRKSKILDSKITKDLPWEGYYLAKKAVGGFFNSSRKIPDVSNHRDANCEIKWVYRTYDGSNINGGYVYAALFTKYPVRRGVEFRWDYKWL